VLTIRLEGTVVVLLLLLLVLSPWPTEFYGVENAQSPHGPPSVAATAAVEVMLMYPGEYHDPSMLADEIENIELLAGNLVDVDVIGQTYQGRNITCLRITNESAAQQKAPILVVAQHHGREQITAELALRFALLLVNGFGVDPEITDSLNTGCSRSGAKPSRTMQMRQPSGGSHVMH
jgi:hypothetical protein